MKHSSRIVDFDVIIIGGGHAGVEGAIAAAKMGCRIGLITMDPTRLALMSCNPAIGGIGKSQLVKEIDALGGIMGEATDASGIQFRRLNLSRGPAVWSTRVQCDRRRYNETADHRQHEDRVVAVFAEDPCQCSKNQKYLRRKATTNHRPNRNTALATSEC